MRLVHQHAVTRGLLMACDEAILVEDLVVVGTLVDTDDQSPRIRPALSNAPRRSPPGRRWPRGAAAPVRSDMAAGSPAVSTARGQSDRSDARAWFHGYAGRRSRRSNARASR